MSRRFIFLFFFFFNDTATTEIYTLSLHDALPISDVLEEENKERISSPLEILSNSRTQHKDKVITIVDKIKRSEEHTSELQSRQYLVCRLLLEKKKNIYKINTYYVNLSLVNIIVNI